MTTISAKQIADTIQEVMDEIKQAEFGFDLIWVLDKIPTEFVSDWGMKSPAVNADLTSKIRKMADNDLLFVARENDDVSEYSIIYYDTEDNKWYTNGYEEGRSEINAADIDSIWKSYVALTYPAEMLDSDDFFTMRTSWRRFVRLPSLCLVLLGLRRLVILSSVFLPAATSRSRTLVTLLLRVVSLVLLLLLVTTVARSTRWAMGALSSACTTSTRTRITE